MATRKKTKNCSADQLSGQGFAFQSLKPTTPQTQNNLINAIFNSRMEVATAVIARDRGAELEERDQSEQLPNWETCHLPPNCAQLITEELDLQHIRGRQIHTGGWVLNLLTRNFVITKLKKAAIDQQWILSRQVSRRESDEGHLGLGLQVTGNLFRDQQAHARRRWRCSPAL